MSDPLATLIIIFGVVFFSVFAVITFMLADIADALEKIADK